MLKTDKSREELFEEIERLRKELAEACQDQEKLRELKKSYVEVLQSVDNRTREIFAIRSNVEMPQLYLDENLKIVGHSADFFRHVTRIAEYARQGADLTVLLHEKDVAALREHITRILAL